MNGTELKGLFRQVFALPAGLTEHQLQLIRASYAKVLPVQETAAALFFARVLTLDPRLHALFKGDINEQGRMLMIMMSTVVDHLHCLGRLVPALRELGRRYDSHGVTERYYDTVAAALIWAVEHELGVDFTAETRDAWTACYGILASEMKAAAHESRMPVLPPC